MTLSELTTVSESLVLVPDAAGGRPALYDSIAERLSSARVTGIVWSVASVSAGRIASLFGLRRDVFVTEFTGFPEHLILIRGEDLGTALAASFTIAVRERLAQSLRRAFRFPHGSRERDEPGSELSAFAATDLAARIAIVRAAFDDALVTISVHEPRSEPWDPSGKRANAQNSMDFWP